MCCLVFKRGLHTWNTCPLLIILFRSENIGKKHADVQAFPMDEDTIAMLNAPNNALIGQFIHQHPMGPIICVGTLKDGYVRNVPLPRVPQIQSASPTTSHEVIAPKAGIPIPGYLHIPSWIPTLPKLGSRLGFSQRLL